MITVCRTGALAVVEDLGRPGYAGIGVSPSGAADRGALRAANRLVGNPEHAAAIEATLGGLEISSDEPVWCAVTGAVTVICLDGRPEATGTTLHLPAHSTLRVEPPTAGLRNYLAVRGGLDLPPVLGSRSADVLSGVGPPPLSAGDRVTVGQLQDGFPDAELLPVRPAGTVGGGDVELTFTPGPRWDWFTPDAVSILAGQSWTVGQDADRTAIRLHGPALERAITAELPSEGLIRGAIQVPTAGEPLIFLADHPVTGGYPVVAVLDETSCDAAAQLRPGDTLRLRRRIRDTGRAAGTPRAAVR